MVPNVIYENYPQTIYVFFKSLQLLLTLSIWKKNVPNMKFAKNLNDWMNICYAALII